MRRPQRRRLGRVALVVGFALPLALLWLVAQRFPALSFVLPLVLNVALAVAFARTLRGDREPLISVFARAERGVLQPDLVRSTRTLTCVWVAFFLAVAAVSVLLAVAAPPAALAWFVVVGDPLLVVALFVGEYVFRRYRFAHYPHASLLAVAAIVLAHFRRTMRR